MQLTACQNRETCQCSIETSKMSILERILTPRVALVDTIRFVSKFYTKNIFHDFPENFDVTWIAVNFRELPRNAGFSGKFCWYHWILHKILCNLCPWQVCRANLGSTVWIWGFVFFIKKKQDLLPCRPQPLTLSRRRRQYPFHAEVVNILAWI